MPNNFEILNQYEQAILAGTITLILENWVDVMPQDTAARLMAQTLAEYILKKYGN